MVRVLKPGGTFAGTVPAWFPEKINWMLSDEYHAPIAEGGHVRIYSATELAAKLRAAGLDLRGHHRAHALHSPYWWLKCAVGPRNDDHPLVVKYREFLEWDIMKQPTSTRIADRVLSPAIGKSIVFYGVEASGRRVSALPELDGVVSADEVHRTATHLVSLQLPSGMIPWFEGGHCDPWNHVESAMALDVAGHHAEAERAYEWLVDTQLPTGGWYAYYANDGSIEDDKIDTNVCAYIAAGVYHHYRSTWDRGFAENLWPAVGTGARVRAVDAPQRRGAVVGRRDRHPAVGLRPADRHVEHPALAAMRRRARRGARHAAPGLDRRPPTA